MNTRCIPGELPTTAVVRVFSALALVLVLLASVTSTAGAQSACATHAEMIEHLTRKYAEAQIAVAFTANGQLVEVYSTGDGATWTIVITSPRGLSCILIAGEAWSERRQAPEDPQA